MRNKIFKLCALILCIFALIGVHAQETVPAAGGNASGSGGSASYTFGQLFYTINAGSSGSVAEGVQQPYEISTMVGLEEARGIQLSCKTYPNPTTDYLTLSIENFDPDGLSYSLFSMNGNLLENEKIMDRETSISMISYRRGTYILKVANKNKEVKTFAIIKN